VNLRYQAILYERGQIFRVKKLLCQRLTENIKTKSRGKNIISNQFQIAPAPFFQSTITDLSVSSTVRSS
jgi:hypothetical protein